MNKFVWINYFCLKTNNLSCNFCCHLRKYYHPFSNFMFLCLHKIDSTSKGIKCVAYLHILEHHVLNNKTFYSLKSNNGNFEWSVQISTDIPKPNISNLSHSQKLSVVKAWHLANPQNLIVLRNFIPTKCDSCVIYTTKCFSGESFFL